MDIGSKTLTWELWEYIITACLPGWAGVIVETVEGNSHPRFCQLKKIGETHDAPTEKETFFW
jgi:hypothetical protein